MDGVHMADQVIDEVRALLFGEEPHARSRAPEPELFAELIPILPKSLLDNVVGLIGHLGAITESQRALLFTALVERFPEAERTELVRRWLEENPMHVCKALSKLAPKLPEPERVDLVEETLEWARTLHSDEQRDEALASVGPLLDELRKGRVLKESLATTQDITPMEEHRKRKATIMGVRARQLLSQLLEGERTTLLEEALDKLLEHYGGAMPPQEEEDDGEDGEELHARIEEVHRRLAEEEPRQARARLRMHATVCSDCGKECEVPFMPDPGRPVFCRECWSKRRGPRRRREHWEQLEREYWERLERAQREEYAQASERERVRVVSPPEERIVNTGFSSKTRAGKALDPTKPLAPKRSYYFWFEVGPRELAPGAIEEEGGVPLDVELLPSDARLKVVLFAFEDEVEISPGRDVGEIQVMPDGKIRVVSQVERPDSIPLSSDLLKRRLFFPVRTPSKEGNFRLRCNIYYEQILVQSRLIQVRVAIKSVRSEIPALKSTLEYSMSKSLNPSYLVRMKPQKLSMMLNSNGDGTHCFRLVGVQDYKSETCFSVRTLESLIKHARSALRQASWGDDKPWTKRKRYRYGRGYNQDQLKDDLISFAICGYRFWARFTQKIAGGKRDSEKLTNIMLRPATLEFAIKDVTDASDHMFPAAMIYDYPLDTNLDRGKYMLCPSFLEALEAGEPLEETSCFKGDCPSWGDLTVICPSGFWGFRHSIGIPLGSASETNHEMTYRNAPEITVAVFPSFKKWPSHQQALKSLRPGMVWHLADTRPDTLDKLQKTSPHLVYFYCHGGIKKDTPYIKVGAKNEKGITPDNLLAHWIQWDSPQPLVFINGCHTTALGPKLVLDFVASFVISCHAAGVIGTEISIFEQLACAFAEECLHRFLAKGETIGEAVRMTRLKLLEQGNPLGLVYITYANASLRLEKAHT